MKRALIAVALATAACGSGSGGTGAVSGGASVGATGSATGSQLPASIVDPYLKIQAALAQDRMDEVRTNAGEIASAATRLGEPATKMNSAAAQLASAGVIADAREKFGTLTDGVVTYMESQQVRAPEGVRKAYCPMARKSWLQKGDTLANPYYGSSMPTCGEFK
jgi:hypothetical protein